MAIINDKWNGLGSAINAHQPLKPNQYDHWNDKQLKYSNDKLITVQLLGQGFSPFIEHAY